MEAVTIVLDLPPPQPGSMSGITSVDRVSASDPKSALALQRLVQAAVSLMLVTFICLRELVDRISHMNEILILN